MEKKSMKWKKFWIPNIYEEAFTIMSDGKATQAQKIVGFLLIMSMPLTW